METGKEYMDLEFANELVYAVDHASSYASDNGVFLIRASERLSELLPNKEREALKEIPPVYA